MNNQGRLAGRKALVTGSGTGIGREVALEFARQGADVVLHYGHSAAGAESAVAEIVEMGRRATAFQADFASPDDAVGLANRAIEFLGGIDCLVNNSGITMNKPFLKVTREQYNTLVDVNFGSPYFITQRVVEDMLSHSGGAVVNMTSIHGVAGAPEHSVYAATKGAIIAYTRTLGVELAHKGVRVNAIAPGWINVENHAKAIPGFNLHDATESARNAVPVGRFGVPLDIAKLAAFLCTEDAGFIVGQTIVVDGGTSSLMSLISDFRNESSHRFGIGYLPDI
jgi:NAD(P)-dependent dehydrogenase (short-subunit alcohol dehydrogenase family)